MSRDAIVRVGCVQFAPMHGQPKENAKTVFRLTSGLEPGQLDILMLPEMALSGYVFRDAGEVEPLLEDVRQGTDASPSLALARALSTRLQCYVLIGFPSQATCFESAAIAASANTSTPYDARPADVVRAIAPTGGHLAYNASLLLDAQGDIVHIFRKHFNYENDKVWATEGPGFETVDLPKIGRVCVAICMDINPYDYNAPFEAFELAHFCQARKVDVLLMNMAWLASDEKGGNDESNDKESRSSAEQSHAEKHSEQAADTVLSPASLSHCNYLATRLSPCILGARAAISTNDAEQAPVLPPRDLAFVTCNRTGFERGSLFAGSSFGINITPGQPPELVGMMGTDEQGVAVFDLKRCQHIE